MVDYPEDYQEEPSGEYHVGLMEEGITNNMQQYGLHKETGYNEHSVHFIGSVAPTPNHICQSCTKSFNSSNKMHKHLWEGKCHPRSKTMTQVYPMEPTAAALNDHVIESDIKPNNRVSGQGFWHWQYTTITAQFNPTGPISSICIDSGCSMTLVNHQFLKDHIPGVIIHQSTHPLTVQGLGEQMHPASKFVLIDIFLPGSSEEGPALAKMI